jgi:signal transduction histidine kinase
VTRILLLLDQAENQHLLRDELAQHYEIVEGSGDTDLELDFDLCVVDGRSLDRLWERVRQRKAREQPIFLPVLLVTSRPGVKMITRHVWRSIDELIITPIEKAELWARIQILLRARALSLSLRTRAEDAEQAARTRDEVLAIVSHDLRNPLNLILTCGVLLQQTADPTDARDRERIAMIQRAAEHMHRLIQDLLDTATVHAGGLSVAAAPVPAAPLIREACALSEHAAAMKSITLGYEIDPDLPPVIADSDRILQVFGNLIGNALKFTSHGGTVTLKAEPTGEVVRFAIVDNGSGIEGADLPYIFDRFWQAANKGVGGAGLGLGLAIARSIIVAHGGEIGVESQPGQGSTFYFTLPAAASTSVEGPAPPQ